MDTCESGEADADAPVVALGSSGTRGIRARTISAENTRGLTVKAKAKSSAAFERSRWINNDLVRRSGAIVFSSSRGNEASLEADEWKQGAFTLKLLEALGGQQAADKNKDGVISVDELESFVSLEVPKLTGNLQHPTVDRDNIYLKFGFPMGR